MTEIMLDKQETLNEIGTKIRKLRESKNLSIQEFADKLEMEYKMCIRDSYYPLPQLRAFFYPISTYTESFQYFVMQNYSKAKNVEEFARCV